MDKFYVFEIYNLSIGSSGSSRENVDEHMPADGTEVLCQMRESLLLKIVNFIAHI